MTHSPEAHRPWFFDCDGVLLDSNRIKTEAFHVVASRYGEDVANDVVQHHVEHGGISRFVKLRRIFDDVLQRAPNPGELEQLLSDFAALVGRGLFDAPVDSNAKELLSTLKARGDRLFVVSGGATGEVQAALRQHGLANHFERIFGSPATKREHIDEIMSHLDLSGGWLVGDSREDMEVGRHFGLRRVLVTHWTEFDAWDRYVEEYPDITVVADLAELAEQLPELTSEG